MPGKATNCDDCHIGQERTFARLFHHDPCNERTERCDERLSMVPVGNDGCMDAGFAGVGAHALAALGRSRAMSSLLGEVVVDEGLVQIACILLMVAGLVVTVWIAVRWRPSGE